MHETTAHAARRMSTRTWLRRWVQRKLWRYRYLTGFIIIGVASVLVESLVLEWVMPDSWPRILSSFLSFLVGMAFAFYMNARFNFRVSQEYFARTFILFSLVSLLSYAANTMLSEYLNLLEWMNYFASRIVTAACLFAIAYSLHRRFTFRATARNLGLALYLVEGEEIEEAFTQVGDQVDHIHLDLVDETFYNAAAPVDLSKLQLARQYWSWQPICLHIMSTQPLRWMEQCWDSVDWVLFHVNVEDDLLDLIAQCRQRGKKVGVVWHCSVTLVQILPYLPHVDYVMVLAIEQPGASGQSILPEALETAKLLHEMAPRYGYDIVFDGGVTTTNVHQIPARIIVSSSSVLKAENPLHNALTLLAGGMYGRD